MKENGAGSSIEEPAEIFLSKTSPTPLHFQVYLVLGPLKLSIREQPYNNLILISNQIQMSHMDFFHQSDDEPRKHLPTNDVDDLLRELGDNIFSFDQDLIGGPEGYEEMSYQSSSQSQPREDINDTPNITLEDQPVPEAHRLEGDQSTILLTPKDFKRCLTKNVNMPKYIGRLLMKYVELYRKAFQIRFPAQDFEWVVERLRHYEQWMNSDKKNTFKLVHLQEFFHNPSKDPSLCLAYRMIMRKILVKHLREEIIENHQVKDKPSYLAAAKVFALRCRSGKLAERMQAK